MSVLVLVVILGVILITWYYWKLPPRSPPVFPGALPIIGHLHQIFQQRNDIWTYFTRAGNFARTGDAYGCLRLGPHILYGICDPEHTGLIANACMEKSFLYTFTKDFIRNGLLISDTKTWKLHRKLLNPALNQQVLNSYADEMNIQSRKLVSQLTPMAGQGPVDCFQFVTAFMLRLICRTSLGLDAEAQDMINNDYAKAIDEILNIFTVRGFHPWLYPSVIYNRTAMKRREDELIRHIKSMMNPVIQKRKFDLRGQNSSGSNEYMQASLTRKFKPFLDLMLHLADENHVFSDEDIREHLDNVVVASYDTSSLAIQNIMLLLGTHPAVQERVHKEVMGIFEDYEDVDKDDLTKCIYLEAVIKEALRLYPPVPFVARKIETDVELPKYTLRAGNTCVLLLNDLNRHPSWGPDAEQFNPERWLNPDTLPTNPNVHAWFSIGKRNCIGKQYGIMVLKTVIAHIVRKFYISADINTLKWKFEVFLKPATPALVTLTLRT